MPSLKKQLSRLRRSNPHDELFHSVFSRKENAADELRHLLPRRISRRIDWSTLRLEGSRFVELAFAHLPAILPS